MQFILEVIALIVILLVAFGATGKTVGKYVVITANSQVVTTKVRSCTLKTPSKKVDVTTLGSGTMENLFGLVDPEVELDMPLDNTASTGSWTVFTPLLGNQTGVPILIDIGIGAAPATGDPRISLTLMSVSNIDTSGIDANGNPTMKVTLSPCVGNVLSYTTKP